jgi:DNA-binding SARP family transcriptional activator
VEVRVLGRVEVVDGQAPLAIGGTKQRAVLAMLALRANKIVSTDFLVDGLGGTRRPVR